MKISRRSELLLTVTAVFLVSGEVLAQGTITGCVTDTSRGALPGVEVAASNDAAQAKVVTAMSGCYDLRGLPVGEYTVTARLAGFNTEKRSTVAVLDGRVTAGIDFVMCVAGGAQVNIDWVLPEGGLEGAWKKSDLVVHARITATAPLLSSCPTADVQHRADVIEALKGDAGRTIAFRQEQYYEEPTPYGVGQELILFLVRWNGELIRLCGPHYAYVINGEQLQSGRPDGPRILTAREFLARLRAFR